LHQEKKILSAKAIHYGGLLAALKVVASNNNFDPNSYLKNPDFQKTFWFDESPGWIIEIANDDFEFVRNKLNTEEVDWYQIVAC